MATPRNSSSLQCVAVDLNTQHDFCDATGVSPVADIPALLPALERVMTWTELHDVPLVSSLESHRPTELSPNGRPLFCVDGSCGQRKLGFTVVQPCAWIEADNTHFCPIDLFQSYRQVIFYKRTEDLLCNPKADRFFTHLPVNEFILFGVGVENSIKALALGLLLRGKPVTIVLDACGYWNKWVADVAIRQMLAKGAQLTTVQDLLDRRPCRRPAQFVWQGSPHALMSAPTAPGPNGSGHHRKTEPPERPEPPLPGP